MYCYVEILGNVLKIVKKKTFVRYGLEYAATILDAFLISDINSLEKIKDMQLGGQNQNSHMKPVLLNC